MLQVIRNARKTVTCLTGILLSCVLYAVAWYILGKRREQILPNTCDSSDINLYSKFYIFVNAI